VDILVKSVVFPTLLYASETWNTTLKDEERLQAFLNTCKYRIAGRTRLEKITIDELDRLVRLPRIRACLARRRLSFLASIFAPSTSELLRDCLCVEIVSTNKKIGGRKIQAWEKRIDGDLEYYLSSHPGSVYQSKSELLERIIEIGKSSSASQRKCRINALWYLNEKVEEVPTPRLVHDRVRDVECENSLCCRKFATRKEMLRHVRNDHVQLESVEGMLLCSVAGCFKQFKTQGWLTRHMHSCHNSNANKPK
jgi:hypothetical protein